ncbi:MAG: hypothetical protein KKE24_09130 [Candidatus Thermoplasmatota archaeon]|nr:hypothetical protein [Candidatus Thermoplasmatota archaeon]
MKFRWTKATLLLTVLAVILAVLSLSLKWYWVDITYEGESTDRVSTYELYLSYWEDSGLRSYPYGFEEAGAVIDIVAMLILVWAFFSLLYLLALVQGGSGFVRGWLMILLAILPIMVYVLFMKSAVEAELNSGLLGYGGEVVSHPTSGFILLVLAAILQVVAVLLRNIQVLNSWLSADTQNETA